MLLSGKAALEADGVVTLVVCDGEGNMDVVRATTANPDT
jgi:hypothetical protein